MYKYAAIIRTLYTYVRICIAIAMIAMQMETLVHKLYFITIGTPVIKVPPQNQKFIKFSNVSFICIAVGYHRPEIEWIKNNLTTIRSSNKYSVINSELGDCMITECGFSSTLTIFNATEIDLGTYSCNAYNEAGNVTRTVQLIIGNVSIIFMQYIANYYESQHIRKNKSIIYIIYTCQLKPHQLCTTLAIFSYICMYN